MDEIVHLDRMQARLPSHMDGGAKFLSLLGIIAGQYQEIEAAFTALLDERSMSTAVGSQLDGIGQIVNLPRLFMQSDSDYRLALSSYVLSLTKSGTPEDVISAYLSITGAPAVTYGEIYPATFTLSGIPTVDLSDPAVAAAINATISKAKPAGVNGLITALGGFDLSQASEADGSGNGPSDAAHGFGTYAFNDSVNSLNATLNNGLLIGFWDPVQQQMDIQMDGVDDYASAAYNSLFDFERTDSFSVFVRLRTSASSWSLFEKGTNTSARRGYRLSIVGGKPRAVLCNDEATNALRVDSNVAVNDGLKHSAAFTYAGTSVPGGILMYVDGAAVAMTTITNTLSATIAAAASPINFGKDANASSGFAAGELYEVWLYKRVLTAPEVANLHNAVAISATNLIAHWFVPTGGGSLSRVI